MRYKLNITIVLSILYSTGLVAQNTLDKLKEKFTVQNDVTVTLNTSYTNVIFETWNRNTVEVEAYLQGENLTEGDSQRFIDNWRINASGNSNEITVSSTAINSREERASSSSLSMRKELQELKMLAPMITELLGPMMENIANNPMPSALKETKANFQFDYGKYKEDEEKYLKQWENQIHEKFGDNSKYLMEDLSNKFKENAKKIETQIQAGGTQFGGNTKPWGEDFGKQMEAWASQFSRGFDTQQNNASVTVYRYTTSLVSTNKTGNAQRIVVIRMPKRAKLKLNIRHGDVKLADISHNVLASLSHSKLSANIIEGEQTFIKAAYSPVFVSQWNSGRLVINYVKNCRIQNAKNIQVNADSSNIFIQELDENGAISGSFGVITIANLGESFSTLNLSMENSDFKLKLPKAAFNFSYSGAQSRISLPKTLETNMSRNFGNLFINGFQKTRSTDKAITINAKYSDIILQ